LGDAAVTEARAKAHDLTVVTRNVADFEPFGVRVLDPFRRLRGSKRVCVASRQEHVLRGRGRMYTFEHSGSPANMSTTMTVRLEDDVKHRLDALAHATRRSKSFLAAEAIRAYVDNNEWQVGEIQAALEEADAGDFAGDNDVAALAKKWKVDAG
jgi:predicted transcriptional regulator